MATSARVSITGRHHLREVPDDSIHPPPRLERTGGVYRAPRDLPGKNYDRKVDIVATRFMEALQSMEALLANTALHDSDFDEFIQGGSQARSNQLARRQHETELSRPRNYQKKDKSHHRPFCGAPPDPASAAGHLVPNSLQNHADSKKQYAYQKWQESSNERTEVRRVLKPYLRSNMRQVNPGKSTHGSS